MASGRAHNTATLLAATALTFATPWIAGRFGAEAAALVPGCLAGLVLSPDLDVDNGSRSNYQIRRFAGVAGGIAAAAWLVLWYPYAVLVPHRSWISHFPLVSTLIRVGYMALITAGFFLTVHKIVLYPWFWWAVGGLALSDVLHWIMDF